MCIVDCSSRLGRARRATDDWLVQYDYDYDDMDLNVRCTLVDGVKLPDVGECCRFTRKGRLPGGARTDTAHFVH